MSIRLFDLGDATVETKQVSFPLTQDSQVVPSRFPN